MTRPEKQTSGPRAAQVALGVVSGLAFALLAFLLMGQEPGPPPLIPFQDKLFHFIAFAGVTAPGVLVLPRRYWPFWLAHMVLVAVGTEIFQSFVYDPRSTSVWDALADFAGIAASTAVCDFIRRKVVGGASD